MVEVVIDYKGDCIRSFSVQGHAGYAPAGEDIYCAGVSAVTQTALLGLLKHLDKKLFYSIEKGNLRCNLPEDLEGKEMETAQLILSTMEAGLLSMQEAYNGYVKVRIRRE